MKTWLLPTALLFFLALDTLAAVYLLTSDIGEYMPLLGLVFLTVAAAGWSELLLRIIFRAKP